MCVILENTIVPVAITINVAKLTVICLCIVFKNFLRYVVFASAFCDDYYRVYKMSLISSHILKLLTTIWIISLRYSILGSG